MKIDIAIEKENAHFRFDKPTINFPFVFTFMDRISKTLIEVNLDLDAFKNLMGEIYTKSKIIDTIEFELEYKKLRNKPKHSPSDIERMRELEIELF